MRFSIIIPTHNRSALLREALDSIFAQTFTDFEVIVVDDGSTDETAAVVASYGDRLRYFQQQNQGPGAARNLGIRNAIGEYVAFLDSDDTWFPWTLKVYSDAIGQCGKPGFAGGREATQAEWTLSKPRAISVMRYGDYYETAAEGLWIGTCGAVVRTDVLRDVGGFTEERMNAEDSDLWLRLGAASGFAWILDPPVFRYHRTNRSQIGRRDLTQRGIETLIAQEKAGFYPGGLRRMRERRRIIARHVRPHVLASLRCGVLVQSLRLYLSTLWWSVREMRVRFLFGFWILLVINMFKSRRRRLL